MNKRINFEDNIFMLHARLALIRDLFALETEPALFLDKTADDIAFIDTATGSLMDNLLENQRLLQRDEQLENLVGLDWEFQQLLLELQSNPFALDDEQNQAFLSKAAPALSRCMERRETLKQMRIENHAAASEPLVSSDEMSELLKGL